MPPAEPTVAGESGALARTVPPPASFSLRRQIWRWAPPVLWMALILLASSDSLGAPRTESWLRRILAAIFTTLPPEKLHILHILLRKAGHLAAYAVLGWLSYRSARGPFPAAPHWSRRAAVYALGFSLATAILDELHQVLTETRSGSAWDVALDMAGVLLAFAVIRVASRRKSKAVATS